MLRTLEIYEDVQCVSSLHFTPGAQAAEINPRSWWVKAGPGPQLAVLIQGYDSSHPSVELSTHNTAVSFCSGKIPQTERRSATVDFGSRQGVVRWVAFHSPFSCLVDRWLDCVSTTSLDAGVKRENEEPPPCLVSFLPPWDTTP